MLINLRNALMSGKRLPYDAEVEYLESTGTQWIDTGFSPGSSFEVFADINTEMTSAERDLMGNLTSYSRGNFVIGVYNNFVFVYINGSTRLDSNSLGTGRKDIAIAYKQDATSRLLTVNGVDYTNTSLVEVINSPIYLFTNGPNLGYNSSMRLRNFKGWNDGVLVRDFIPVRKGTVGYLYDRVSKRLFGNAGTGDFVLGPDVVPVEYIESHGTEYIDTGVVPGGKIINAEVAFKQLRLNGTVSGIIGSNVNDGRDNFQLTCFNSQWRLKLNNYASFNGAPDTNTHVLKLNTAQGTFLDSRQLATSQYTIGASNTKNIFLGACNYNGSSVDSGFPYRLIGELYYAKIYANGELIRDYIPVRVGNGSTWEGAMMDTLTRRIYRNAGTGNIGYGNDLKYPIPAE